MNYLAHIAEDGREQLLIDHLKGTAQRCADFAAPFNAADYAQQMAYLHDLGKGSTEAGGDWQTYIREVQQTPEIKGPDHSTAGAQELLRRGMPQAAMCVAGHHAGLPDLGGKGDASDEPTLLGRKRKHVGNCSDFFYQVEPMLEHASLPQLPLDNVTQSFLIRMLFSCLTDADFLDTEEFMHGAREENGVELSSLRMAFEKHIDGWLKPPKELATDASAEDVRHAAVNRHRTQILRACLEAGKGERGLYSLTVPTGGGKTTASLAFALQHAKAHKEIRRIIYVIPYQNIIRQNAQVFRESVGEEYVLEHHSGISYDQEETEAFSPQKECARLACENWDMPLIVTTNVQFFESLYACRTSRCRKLHNLVDSIVIFDEAQMLPLDYLKPCVRGIEELVRHYGVTAVLCTATQPSLSGFFSKVPPKGEMPLTIREIVPDVPQQYAFFRRTSIRNGGRMDMQRVAEKMVEQNSALAIVNTLRQARELYQCLPEESRYHLSNLMAPKDQLTVIETVKERLAKGEPCHLAATSLVEAGVDLDFEAVFREAAGLDSVLQAAGRCNREGRHPAEESIVYVFTTEHRPGNDVARRAQVYREIAERFEDVSAPGAVSAYFDSLYAEAGKSLDKKEILPSLEKGNAGRMLPLRWVGENFKLIEENTYQLLLPLDDTAKELSKKILDGCATRKDYRKAAPYIVSVRKKLFDTYVRLCATPVGHDFGVMGSLTDTSGTISYYNSKVGIDPAPQQGAALIL